MRYLTMTSGGAAVIVSERIFACSRPVHVREPEDVSNQYSHHLTHPGNTAWVLPVNTAETIYIHPEVDKHTFDALLQPFIDAGLVTEAEKIHLQDELDGARGGRLNIYDTFPAYWRNTSKSYEDLVEEGWFD